MSKQIKLDSGYKVIEFEELDSTMITLKELAVKGCDIKTVVCAKKQKRGRGRQGRSWVSPKGNLYYSFLRNPEDKNSKNMFAPVFIVALTIVDTIKTISNNKIIPTIKWPNDILINRSKIAGILIENINLTGNKNLLNIGIGINIVSNPINTLYPSTNLKKENINTSYREVLQIFFDKLILFEKIYISKGANEIYKMWSIFAHKIGDPISVKIGDRKIFGTFNGLNEEGGLLLLNELGDIKVILAGDIFLL